MTLNEISKNSFKVVIIGFGNIGKRYLEGIINSKLFLEIFIIDVNRQNFDITLVNKSNLNININFDNDLTKLPYDLDLVIISTTADVRFYVFKKILTYNTKYIILEKVLFSDYQHYRKVKRMIRNTPTNIWVNHPRRLYPLYQKLKEFIDNKKPINMVVNGGNWALASNSLHFVDLWLSLIGNHNYSISKNFDNLNLIASKRDGFDEFYGEIAFYSGHNTLILISNNEISDLKVSIINGEEFFSINETSKYCSFFEYNKEEQLDNLIPYQSELSLSLVENILVNKSSKLPLIDISLKTHIPFIRFVKQYSKHVKRKIKIT